MWRRFSEVRFTDVETSDELESQFPSSEGYVVAPMKGMLEFWFGQNCNSELRVTQTTRIFW